MAVFAERIDETMVARMQSFFQTLSEKDQRRYSALESQQFGHGGISYFVEKCPKELAHGSEKLAQFRRSR